MIFIFSLLASLLFGSVLGNFSNMTSTATTIRCGYDWSDANSRCGTSCPSRTDSECPSGQRCFADLSPCDSPTPTPGTTGQIGYWWWTWSGSKAAPSGTNLGVAFSGWTDPYSAVGESATIKPKLPGTKYISLGGGNANGRFSASSVQSITNAINNGVFAGYDGIVYDIEEGDSGLSSLFAQSFAAAKARGYKVLVTVSHSAPYGISDAASLMRSFFPNVNIDILSPQLYTTGGETSNSYATVAGVGWNEYASAKAAIVPSISYAYLYSDAQNYFKSVGVTTQGYVQWAQV